MRPQPADFFLMAVHRYRFHLSIASSSRSIARRSGFWHDQPRSSRRRPTCARWKRTPNSRRTSSAMRFVVHRSVLYPHAMAPRNRSVGNFFNCAGRSFVGRPGAGLAVSPESPRRRSVSRQRMTELCEQPRRRATAVIDRPDFSNSTARRRRLSSSAGLPCGRMDTW